MLRIAKSQFEILLDSIWDLWYTNIWSLMELVQEWFYNYYWNAFYYLREESRVLTRNIIVDFGLRLKSLRLENNLSQAKLAQALSLSANTISQYETGKRFPDQRGIITICRFFNITADYLLGLSDNKRTTDDNFSSKFLNEKQQNAINELISAFKNDEE